MEVILLVLAIVFLVGGIFGVAAQNEEKERRKETERARAKAAERDRAEREERRAAYEAALAALVSDEGEADKTIVIAEYDLDGEIRAYSATHSVIILGRRYAFGDILGCSVSDDHSVRKGAATVDLSGETDSKTGSVVGRAIVGGVLAGPAGAVVGGATASKEVEMSGTVSFGDDTVLHDYTVRVTVRDIARPSVSIHIGADAAKAAEVAALFEVIIDGNRRG